MSEISGIVQDTDLMAQVAWKLEALDPTMNAQLLHGGDGIFGVYLELSDGRSLFWATTGPTWVGDISSREGDYVGSLETTIPSDAADPDAIAAGIHALVLSQVGVTPLSDR